MFQQTELSRSFDQYLSDNASLLKTQLDELYQTINRGEQPIWNKAFKLLPSVVFINPEQHQRFASQVEQYHLVLRKMLTLYRQQADVRAYFDFEPLIESLCMIEPGYENEIVICRFDSYASGEGFKLLENNTDCPAGVLFTHRHSEAITGLGVIESFIEQAGTVAKTRNMSDMGFFDTLFAAHKERTGKAVENSVCILQLEKGISAEVKLMMQVLADAGINCVIADPRQLSFDGTDLSCNGEKIDLLWNKINTCFFNQLLENPDDVKALLESVSGGHVTHVNSFASRYITESKLSLAFLHDNRFTHYFDEQEQDIIAQLLPWACRIDDDNVSYQGDTCSAMAIALKHKDNFVLKQPYDIRGEGVVLGKECDDQQWQVLLQGGIEKQCILQALIDVAQMDVFDPDSGEFIAFNSSLDFFMFDGKFAGFGSKLSKQLKVNIFQGGSKNVVLPLSV